MAKYGFFNPYFPRFYSLREKRPNTEFFWSDFPAFGLNTERHSISTYSVRMRENTDLKKLRIWTLFTQWLLYWKIRVRKNLKPWNHFTFKHFADQNILKKIGFFVVVAEKTYFLSLILRIDWFPCSLSFWLSVVIKCCFLEINLCIPYSLF